jgi:tRNA (guanine37-N1)-methyltransferase
MDRPCLRVPRDHGETARQALAEAGALNRDYRIEAVDGYVYLPVADATPPLDAVRAAIGADADADAAPTATDGTDGTDGDDAEGPELAVVDRAVEDRRTPTTPADLLGYEPSIERLGEVAIVDVDDPDRAREVADAVVASDLPVDAVLNRASKVKGEHRVRDWEVLAGTGTETTHREYGFDYRVDVASVYFSPRLATERHRVTERVAAGDHVVDMFAGVGPFAIPMAARGAEVVAVDVNPAAIAFLRDNVARNGVADRVRVREGDVREVAPAFADWADRLVMNLPHSAHEFVDAAVEMAGDDAVIHYYDIQPDDDPFARGERAIREAAGDDYAADVTDRHVVRSYAPHEVNVRLDVRLTRRRG